MPKQKEPVNDVLQKKLNDANQKIETLVAELNDANQKIETLKNELNIANQTNEELIKDNDFVRSELSSVNEQKSNLEIEFQQLKENSLAKDNLKSMFDKYFENIQKLLETEPSIIKRYELKIQLETFIAIANQIIG